MPGPIIISAGGSAFYDLVVERFGKAGIAREVLVVTRSGCYLTHKLEDVSRGLRGDPQACAEPGQSQYRPDAGSGGVGLCPVRAGVDEGDPCGGKRDISYDVDLPVPLKWVRPRAGVDARAIAELGAGHVVTGLNDQHCHLAVPADSPLVVGDMVAFGISHPCTTFDKWQCHPLVDDEYTVVSAIKTSLTSLEDYAGERSASLRSVHDRAITNSRLSDSQTRASALPARVTSVGSGARLQTPRCSVPPSRTPSWRGKA